MKVEILHQRDPDAGCVHTVFVDGVAIEDYTVEDVDPGAGYERADWDARFEMDESYSPAFREATVAALTAAGDSPYIVEEWPS
jgi:hypothetical protein